MSDGPCIMNGLNATLTLEYRRRLISLSHFLSKRIAKMTALCCRFTICSLLLQMIENEILQNQACVIKSKYENACVIENEDMSGGIVTVMDALKLANCFVSLIAG